MGFFLVVGFVGFFFAAGNRFMEVLASSDLQSEAYMDSVKADLDKYLRSDLLRVTKQMHHILLGKSE